MDEEYQVIVETLITITITQKSAVRQGAFQFMTLDELDRPVMHKLPAAGTVYNTGCIKKCPNYKIVSRLDI